LWFKAPRLVRQSRAFFDLSVQAHHPGAYVGLCVGDREPRARDAATVIREIWFAPDSPVEEAGFEPSVPGKRDRTIDTVSAFYVIARTAMTPWPWLDHVGSSRQIQAADN
jgi:hypothetical protein